jgi:hypothetical protein
MLTDHTTCSALDFGQFLPNVQAHSAYGSKRGVELGYRFRDGARPKQITVRPLTTARPVHLRKLMQIQYVVRPRSMLVSL